MPESGVAKDDHCRVKARLAQKQICFTCTPGTPSGADAMTDETRQSAHPILNSMEAHLFVADFGRSCDFYTNKLGFAVAFVYGDPPFTGRSFGIMPGSTCP
jgi:hypothetical protein